MDTRLKVLQGDQVSGGKTKKESGWRWEESQKGLGKGESMPEGGARPGEAA